MPTSRGRSSVASVAVAAGVLWPVSVRVVVVVLLIVSTSSVSGRTVNQWAMAFNPDTSRGPCVVGFVYISDTGRGFGGIFSAACAYRCAVAS